MSKTAFEQLIDKLGNMSGGHLPLRGAEIARIAWNAAIDAATEATMTVSIKNGGVWYADEASEKCRSEIQKLRSE